MQYLYLDESGDLGHNFAKSGTSRYFVITILSVRDRRTTQKFEKAIIRTVKYKLPRRHRRFEPELKGTRTTIGVKRYFYRLIKDASFQLYAVILDKRTCRRQLQDSKSRVYNFITRLAVQAIPLEDISGRVTITIDRSKGKLAIREFDRYLLNQLEACVPPETSLDIWHQDSLENKILQAVDLFAWGIYRKYEAKDVQWYSVFKDMIAYEEVYPSTHK